MMRLAKRFASDITGQKVALAVLLVLTALNIFFTLLVPWPLKIIVDNLLTSGPPPNGTINLSSDSSSAILVGLALLTLLFYLAQYATQMGANYLRIGISTRMKVKLSGELLSHLQKLDSKFHSDAKTGDLTQRVMRDTTFPGELLSGVVIPALTAALTLVSIGVVLWNIEPLLGGIALLSGLPIPLLVKHYMPRITDRSYREYTAVGSLASLAEQTFTSIPVVQAFNRQPREDERFKAGSNVAVEAVLQAQAVELKFAFGTGLSRAIGSAAVLIAGGFLVRDGAISIGTLVVALAYLNFIYGPMSAVAEISAAYGSCAGKARRVLEILDRRTEVADSPDAVTLTRPDESTGITVRLEGVGFRYGSGDPVLDGVDLTIGAGETVAIIGQSGAGKSTLAALVMRLADPDKGRVLLDGCDLRNLTIKSVRDQIAVVLQDTFLLPVSVLENIAVSRYLATREEIISAAIDAKADEFIRNLPEGYDTLLDEKGANLSGGQRQRLSIARAILRDARLMILDEPTSALDAETEDSVLSVLESLKHRRTMLLISHRSSTLRIADRVLVLKDGMLFEQN